MVQVCNYSSLIFAANTTVLIIVSLTTDYWEYRSFDHEIILKSFQKSNKTRIVFPYDTDSYLQIKFNSKDNKALKNVSDLVLEEKFYHAPIFATRRYLLANQNEYTLSSGTRNAKDVGMLVWYEEHILNLFVQYGNLFRDCDALEDAVRYRLGLENARPAKCVYFDTSKQMSTVYAHAPALTHLELFASVLGLLCILSTCVGSSAGAYGLFSRPRYFKAYFMASCLSLFAGFSLTIGIAVFHAKCHVLRKLEILPDLDLPFREQLNSARVYTYGWSFVLAWTCVFFCYASSFVWLYKSQGGHVRTARRTENAQDVKRQLILRFVHQNNDDIHDIATV